MFVVSLQDNSSNNVSQSRVLWGDLFQVEHVAWEMAP